MDTHAKELAFAVRHLTIMEESLQALREQHERRIASLQSEIARYVSRKTLPGGLVVPCGLTEGMNSLLVADASNQKLRGGYCTL